MGQREGVEAMTIKEIEERTGMSRANIRYYEAEGLVAPERKENGYRVYSENDAQTLLRIKLLRTLGISLEEIKALQSGKERLAPALDRHLVALSQRWDQMKRTGEVTRQMVSDTQEYDTLDAARYLQALEPGGVALTRDVQPRLNLPWRRYWARNFDLLLYNSAVSLLFERFVLRESLTVLFTLVAMLLVEPLLLLLFGTTPGKAIFGIRVTDPEDGKLGYGEGLERTWMVLWEGMALNIPLISLYFQYKSLVAAENSEQLSWEKDSELSYQDDAMWRYGLLAAAYLIFFFINLLTVL